MENACRILVENLEERTIERPRNRWEDTIIMDLKKIGCSDWLGLIWLRIGTGGMLL
jgi:hypothetical protein